MSEEDYETIESRLFMAVAAFESKSAKAWGAWQPPADTQKDEAADMINRGDIYDNEGNTLSEFSNLSEIYDEITIAVEKEYNCKIHVDGEGEVSATHHLSDGDTITV